MPIILSLKLGHHEGLTPFIHSRLLKRTPLVVLPGILIRIPIRASMSPVPACWRPVLDFVVMPGSCWPDASAPAPSSGKVSISFVYFALFLLLLMLLVLLVKPLIFNL